MDTEKYSRRAPCKRCNTSALEVTIERNGGICANCRKAMTKEQWDEHVQASVQFLDPFEGLTDPIDILAVKYRKKTKGSFWIREKSYPLGAIELCDRLTKSDEPHVVKKLIALVDEKKSRIANEIAADIARYTNINIDSFLLHLLALDKQFGGSSYLGAGQTVREALLAKFPKDSQQESSADSEATLALQRNLESLAWIGDERVASLFSQWRKQQPDWSNQFNYPVYESTRTAGWEATIDGKRRDLFFKNCFPTLPKESSRADECIGRMFARTSAHCPWCSASLICLLDVPQQMQNGIFPYPIQIATCEFCIFDCKVLYWESRTKRLSLRSGEAHRSESNQNRSVMKRRALPVSNSPRNPYYSCDPFSEHPSQLGGFPSWLQDPDYPECSSCDETMKFIGQAVDDDSSDTYFYCFICERCPDISAAQVQYT